MKLIKLFLILMISLFTFADPVIPPLSPTPGLSMEAQGVNYRVLTTGHIMKQATIEGRKYNLREINYFEEIRNGPSTENTVCVVVVLYNDNNHVILMAKVNNFDIRFGLGLEIPDPFPHPGRQISKTVRMDHKKYTVKIITEREGTAVLCYNENNHYIFAMADPSGGVIVPQ